MIKVELPATPQTYTALARLFSELAGVEPTLVRGLAPAEPFVAPVIEEVEVPVVAAPPPVAEARTLVPAPPITAATAFSSEVPGESTEDPHPIKLESPVELDTNGLPWDYRIHAASKGRVAGGTWRYKKGVDKIALVHRVEAELRAAIAASTSAVATGPNTPVAQEPPRVPTTFPELTQRMTTSPIPKETLDAALASVGLASFTLLATRPDLIPDVEAALFPGGV